MTTRKLEPSEWGSYFDYVSKHLPSTRVRISVGSEDIGAQLEAEDSNLIGITYDHGSATLEIATPGLTHRIANPNEVYVREKEGLLSSLEVLDSEGRKQIVEIVPLTALPTP